MKKSDTLIYGIRVVIEAVKSGENLDKLLIKKGLQGELMQELFSVLKSNKIHYQYVPLEKLNRITQKNHQGVIGFISLIDYYNIEDIIISVFETGKNPFVIILDQVSDVRNFGAICRVAECAGVDAVIIPETGSAQINADAIKTSAGALNYLKICKSKNLFNTIKYLKDSGLKIVAATEKGEMYYYNSKYNQPVAIIFGSEDKGVSYKLLQVTDEIVKIPILGKIESLNVSTAVSTIIYEAVRQRQLNQ